MCCHVSSTNNGVYKYLKRSAANSLQHIAISCSESGKGNRFVARRKQNLKLKEHRSLRSENYSEQLPLARPAYFLIGPLLWQTSPHDNSTGFLCLQTERWRRRQRRLSWILSYICTCMPWISYTNFYFRKNCKNAEIYSSSTNYAHYLAHSSST